MVSPIYFLGSFVQGPGLRVAAALQGKRAEGRNEGRSFEMPRNIRVGHVEPDAVPGPVFADSGFQESETAADAVPARGGQRPGAGGAFSGPLPVGRRRTTRWRGVVERPAKKGERGRAGSRFLPFGRGEFAARRQDEMRRRVGVLMHMNFMAFDRRHAEFFLDGLSGVGEKALPKAVVAAGLRHEVFQCVNGPLHRCLPFSRTLQSSPVMRSAA